MNDTYTSHKESEVTLMLRSAPAHSASGLNPKAGHPEPGDNMAADPNLTYLHQIVDAFRESEAVTKRLRAEVDRYIQELKRRGYSYPVLARESGFAQGTIQLIVAKDVQPEDTDLQ